LTRDFAGATGGGRRLDLDTAAFDADRQSGAVQARIRRDVESGLDSGQVHGTPTLFIDGVLHQGGYDTASLLEAHERYGVSATAASGVTTRKVKLSTR
jgi:protein-disulfide isomerase